VSFFKENLRALVTCNMLLSGLQNTEGSGRYFLIFHSHENLMKKRKRFSWKNYYKIQII